MPVELPSTLYHFTNAAGLVGILQSGHYHATDIRFLNDYSEVEYSVELTKKLISERRRTTASDLQLRLLDALKDAVDWITEHPIFVFCLSEERDQLSQWRAYSGQGAFSIGFEVEPLRHILDVEFSKCHYEHPYHISLIENNLDFALENVTTCESEEGETRFGSFYGDPVVHFLDAFTHNAIAIKHESFHEEKEWRFFVSKHPSSLSETPSVKVASGRLLPYYPIPLSNGEEHLPVSSITVGPSKSQSLDAKACKQMLDEVGLTADVSRSAIPLRTW